MKIEPRGDYVLLTEEQPKTTTASGIIIEGANDNTKIYKVAGYGDAVEGISLNDAYIIDIAKVIVAKQQGKFYALTKVENLIAKVSE